MWRWNHLIKKSSRQLPKRAESLKSFRRKIQKWEHWSLKENWYREFKKYWIDYKYKRTWSKNQSKRRSNNVHEKGVRRCKIQQLSSPWQQLKSSSWDRLIEQPHQSDHNLKWRVDKRAWSIRASKWSNQNETRPKG